MSQDVLRILFVSHLGDLKGGADKMFLRLLLNLDRTLIAPLVLIPYRGSKSLAEALDEANIPYIRWHYNSWINYHHHFPRKVYRLLSNLMAAIILYFRLRGRIDLVYTNTLFSPFGALLARLLRVPHVWHVHEFIEEDMGATYDWGRRRSMQFVKDASAKVLCNSQAVCQKMAQSISLGKLQVVYYGVFERVDNPESLARAQPLHVGTTCHVSIVGRVSKAKGQEEAIRAIHQLLQTGFDIHLHVAGEGTPMYTQELKNLVVALDIESHITWHGFADPFAVYAQVDVNLVCSRSEAFGLVVIEPMSVGCPVIGANAGAIPELVGDGERGLVYTPGDYAMLAQQIKKLLTDHQLYQRVSFSACQFAYQNFVVKDYVKVVEEVLSSARVHA